MQLGCKSPRYAVRATVACSDPHPHPQPDLLSRNTRLCRGSLGYSVWSSPSAWEGSGRASGTAHPDRQQSRAGTGPAGGGTLASPHALLHGECRLRAAPSPPPGSLAPSVEGASFLQGPHCRWCRRGHCGGSRSRVWNSVLGRGLGAASAGECRAPQPCPSQFSADCASKFPRAGTLASRALALSGHLSRPLTPNSVQPGRSAAGRQGRQRAPGQNREVPPGLGCCIAPTSRCPAPSSRAALPAVVARGLPNLPPGVGRPPGRMWDMTD